MVVRGTLEVSGVWGRGEVVLCQRPVNMFLFSVIICIQKMCYIRFFVSVCANTRLPGAGYKF